MRRLGFALFLSFSLAALGVGGDNKWTSNGPYGGRIDSFSVHPDVKDLVFATTGDGVFRSLDRGRTWTRILGSPATSVIRIHPDNAGTILAFNYSVMASTDRGSTWHEVSPSPVPGDAFSDVEFDPSFSSVLYGVTESCGVFKSADGGKTWQSRNSGLPLHQPDSGYTFPQIEVDPADSRVIYVLLGSSRVFKTTDGGDSWRRASGGLGDFGSGKSLVIDPVNSQVLYVGSHGGQQLFKTTNGGDLWRLIPGRNSTSLSIDPAKPELLT